MKKRDRNGPDLKIITTSPEPFQLIGHTLRFYTQTKDEQMLPHESTVEEVSFV